MVMKKILLVEDNKTIIIGLKYSLEQEGFVIISAKTKKETEEIISKQEMVLVYAS